MLIAEASHLRSTNMLDISRLDAATSEAIPPQSIGAKQHRYKLPNLRFQLYARWNEARLCQGCAAEHERLGDGRAAAGVRTRL